MRIPTNENYYDQDEYMSVSAFKKFKFCEVAGMDVFNVVSDAMLIGSYVDAYVEGTLNQFKADHPEIISSKGATKGELKADFKKADEICRFIANDKTLQQFLSGQKQIIMVGKIAGVPFKIKMDSYSPDIAISDLKVMRTITNNDGNYYDFITRWGYDIQLACYQEIVRQNAGKKLPCFICAVTKEDPIDSAVINLPQYVLDKALYKVEENIEKFYNIKTGKVEPVGCGFCSSCIAKRKQTPIISMEDFIDFL